MERRNSTKATELPTKKTFGLAMATAQEMSRVTNQEFCGLGQNLPHRSVWPFEHRARTSPCVGALFGFSKDRRNQHPPIWVSTLLCFILTNTPCMNGATSGGGFEPFVEHGRPWPVQEPLTGPGLPLPHPQQLKIT